MRCLQSLFLHKNYQNTIFYRKYLSKFSRGHKSFKQVIYGKLNFYKSVRGVTDHYYQQMAKLFNTLSPDMKLLLKPTPEEIIQKAVWVIDNTVNAEKNDSPIERMSQGTCLSVTKEKRRIKLLHIFGRNIFLDKIADFKDKVNSKMC